MTSPHWPLTGLRLRTSRLELRWPTLRDLDELAELAAGGVHDPGVQPFKVAWTDASPSDRARSTLQFHWAKWAAWHPSDWSLNLVAAVDGVIAGTQGMNGQDFGVTREVTTGSWLGLGHQGRGIGSEMRAAVLHLAFEGLGAEDARSSAHEDNAASLAVSRKLGYAEDGIERYVVRGRAVRGIRLRLDRAAWQAHRCVLVELSGLEPCLPWFGLAP